MRTTALAAALATLLQFTAGSAWAWSAGGHMVTAAIAYDDLKAADPAALKRLLLILEHHPDRGAFQVAAGDLAGEAHDRALFEECARWPDDARGTPFDHPTWHYALRPLGHTSPSGAAANDVDGQAREALALNARVLADPRAPQAERAVALCWVVHVLADMHQPLHAAQRLGSDGAGDHGGATALVVDPVDGTTISLHWLWDLAIERSTDPLKVADDARGLEAGGDQPPAAAGDADALFQTVSKESYALAETVAYGAQAPLAAGSAPAPVSPAYGQRMKAIAALRAVTAGHRIASLLRAAAQ